MSISVDNKYVRLVSGRLRNFKQKNQNLYNSSCCFCGDSKKNLLKARMYIFEKKGGLFVKCHNCGIGTNVAGLLKNLDDTLYKEYVMEQYTSGRSNNYTQTKTITQLSSPKFGKVEKQKVFEFAEWCDKLPQEHFCIQYLKRRKIPESCYKLLLFTDNYSNFVTSIVPNHGKQLLADARLVIPFYDENDELIAVSGRALETSDKTLRYVTIRTNENKNKLVYGLDRVDNTKKIFLVEGPIDSLFLNNSLASGDANLALTAKELQNDNVVLIFDNEPRNKEVVKMISNAIDSDFEVVIWPNTIQGKDINEMIINGISSDDISKIISSNTFKGIEAKLKFNMWKRV